MALVKRHLAKIAIPQAQGAYARTRLFLLLDSARQQRIVWIAAPPGSGKTTLASSYLLSRTVKTLWYQLDASDNDIASFFHYFAIAMKVASPRYRKTIPPLTPEYLPGLLNFSRRYFETIGQRFENGAVIVLDNYHEVGPEAHLHEVLREAAQSLPSTVSLIILSRADPPPSLSRFQLHGDLVLLATDELQLTVAEAHEIALLRSPSTSLERISELHKLTKGWVAGYRLLLDRDKHSENKPSLVTLETQQLLFDYFAKEVFERWAESIQTALLKTSVLSIMTVPQAEKLACESDIGKILTDLHKNNYFVVMRMEDEPRYEFHSLFRDFLLNRAQSILDPTEWRTLQRRAAELLEKSNETDAAVVLYYASKDWNGLYNLILNEAAALIGAGRHQTLLQWLDWLPPAEYMHAPWLGYWRGQARLPFDAIEARTIFERAYLDFRVADDVTGLYLAWAGVMDTFFYEWRDFTPVDRWIAEFERLRLSHPEFPSQTVELRTYWSIGTLMHRAPQHPFLRNWAERGLRLLGTSERDLSLLLGGYLIVCFLWWGDTARARDVIDRLNPWTKSSDSSPLVFILWSCAVALYHSVRGELDGCAAAVNVALELARRTGLHTFDFLLYGQIARCSLISGNTNEADSWMTLMFQTMRNHSHIDGTFYQHLQSNAAAQRGDWLKSVEYARIGLAMSIEAGTPFPEAHCRIDLARALIGQGVELGWTEQLDCARAIGKGMGSRVLEYLCVETAAIASFKFGDENEGLAQLTYALSISHAMDGATWMLEGPKVSADLYNRALSANIEVSHVQRLIRDRNLTPPNPSTAAKLWPWPVKVYTLGRFEVLLNDEPLKSARKPQHKPLELLKCLCTFAGNAVNQDRIAEILWPNADGDLAEQSLSITLHRLRKLLKCELAVVLKDRYVSLDTNYIWIDCLAFNRATHSHSMTGQTAIQSVLELYSGHFLNGEMSPYILAFREQLRGRYLRIVERLGDIYEQTQDWHNAASCYLGVIEVEPAGELFHRRLMKVYSQLGRRAEALAVYKRCRQSLLTQLGVSPTEETQKLYKLLSNS